MSYERGNLTKLRFEVRNEAGDLADPSEVRLLIKPPAADDYPLTYPPSGDIVREDAGLYYSVLELIEAGTWEYRWETDGDPEADKSGSVFVEGDAFSAEGEPMRPTVKDVAAHLRARTKDTMGNEVGTFNDDTRPTAAQVEELIPKGLRRVTSHIGVTICEGDDADKQAMLYGDARDLAALATALRIEREYFPEQVGTGRSPYAEMLVEYKDSVKTLIEAVSEHCGGGDGESVGGIGPMPAYGFPEASGIGSRIW